MQAIANYVQAKVHNAVAAEHRPSSVTEAQHKHLKAFPACAACGSVQECQAHHIDPYNENPAKGADPTNFITLCEHLEGEHHHLKLGHGGDFKHYNPNVVADSKAIMDSKTDAERHIVLARAAAGRKVNAPSPHAPKG
jgi:hypothetical protein